MMEAFFVGEILNLHRAMPKEGWHDNWGLGIRIMVMGMPLRLDLGFPMSDPSKSGASTQFHFSGGTRF